MPAEGYVWQNKLPYIHMQLPSKLAAHQADEAERQLLLQLLQVPGGLVGQPTRRPPGEGLQSACECDAECCYCNGAQCAQVHVRSMQASVTQGLYHACTSSCL